MALLLEDVSLAIKNVEYVLRGQPKMTPIEIDAWMQSCREFYDRASSKDATVVCAHFTAQDKTHHVEMAVKLYNKVRNMPSSPALQEVKCFLKGACAWMFSLFADKNSKVLGILIKTLSKCGADFATLYHEQALAVRCWAMVSQLWSYGQETDVVKDLPPLEIALLKECVFNSLLHNAELAGAEEQRGILTHAVALAQELSLRSRLALVDHLMVAAREHGRTNADISFKLINQALGLLDRPQAQGKDRDKDRDQEDSAALQAEVVDAKVKLHLYLAFLHADCDEILAARASIDAIDDLQAVSSKLLTATVLYAKVLVACKANDLSNSLALVRALLGTDEPAFPTALSAVKRVAELLIAQQGAQAVAAYTELYKMLPIKHYSDPAFTNIRIAHLQTSLAAERPDEGAMDKSHEIAARILSDHNNRIHPLDADNRLRFRDLLLDQIALSHEAAQWKRTVRWADHLLALLEDEEVAAEVSLVKIDALLALGDWGNALQAARRTKDRGSREVVAFFRCLLHCEEIPKHIVVKHFLQELSPPEDLDQVASRLIQLEQCCYEVQQCRAKGKDGIIVGLLWAWLVLYRDSRAWSAEKMEEAPAALFAMALAYCSQLLQCQDKVEGCLDIGADKQPSAAYLLPEISSKLLALLDLLMHVIQEADPTALGTSDQLEQIANFATVAGYVHLKASMGQLPASGPSEGPGVLPALQAGGHFYGMAAALYALCNEEVRSRRMKCLLLSAGAHLDAFRALDLQDDPHAMEEQEQDADHHLTTARALCQQIDQLASEGDPLHRTPEDVQPLSSSAVLQMASYCFGGTAEDCAAYIAGQTAAGRWAMLPVSSLMHCIDLATSSGVCSLDTLRSLLLAVLEVCKERSAAGSTLGLLYCRLLELAPTRQAAAVLLQEIIGQLRGGAAMDQEDIDQMFALAYNYGLALADLDQLSLAEHFLVLTQALAPYTSPAMQVWLPRVSEAAASIAKSQLGASAMAMVDPVDSKVGRKRTADEALSPVAGKLTMETFA